MPYYFCIPNALFCLHILLCLHIIQYIDRVRHSLYKQAIKAINKLKHYVYSKILNKIRH